MVTAIDNHIIDEYVSEGLVTARPHLRLPLRVLNYTPQCQHGNLWNWFTKQARGLVVDDHGTIIARGFDKFFNLEEHGSLDIPGQHFVAYDKLDGSLIIVFHYAGQTIACSRGSFESDQAKWAQEIIRECGFTAPGEASICFELIHPENRIVVDYGGTRDLVYLGHRTQAGGDYWFPDDTPFPAAQRYLVDSVGDLPQRDNAEGFVLHWPNGFRVKIKYDRYVEMHRAIFGLTERKILEAVKGGYSEDLRQDLPEEFYEWYDGVVDDLHRRYRELLTEILDYYKKIRHIRSRRDFAREATGYKYSGMLFALRDNKPMGSKMWKIIEQDIKRESNESS